jgi:hypothetical protein
MVRSKFDGLRQVWKVLTGTYAHPIASPVHTLRPARDTCEGCHWPAKHYGDKLKPHRPILGRREEHRQLHRAFAQDRRWRGQAGQQHGGIHWWHIYADNKIRYLATDKRRQEIAWVELTTPDGKRTEFVRDDAQAVAPARIAAEARLMDCIDCHNRPTHLVRKSGQGNGFGPAAAGRSACASILQARSGEGGLAVVSNPRAGRGWCARRGQQVLRNDLPGDHRQAGRPGRARRPRKRLGSMTARSSPR